MLESEQDNFQFRMEHIDPEFLNKTFHDFGYKNVNYTTPIKLVVAPAECVPDSTKMKVRVFAFIKYKG